MSPRPARRPAEPPPRTADRARADGAGPAAAAADPLLLRPVLGGVAGGLGRYFDIDPIIFRIGFVVLAIAGGAGLLAYLAAWLLVPADPVPGQEPADRSRAATIVGRHRARARRAAC